MYRWFSICKGSSAPT